MGKGVGPTELVLSQDSGDQLLIRAALANIDSPNEAHRCQALSGSMASNASSESVPLKSSILPWLSKAKVLEAHQYLQTDRCKPTCQWFLQSDEVMAWKRATDSCLLWVHGKREYLCASSEQVLILSAGCGKSTLMYVT